MLAGRVVLTPVLAGLLALSLACGLSEKKFQHAWKIYVTDAGRAVSSYYEEHGRLPESLSQAMRVSDDSITVLLRYKKNSENEFTVWLPRVALSALSETGPTEPAKSVEPSSGDVIGTFNSSGELLVGSW